MEPLHYAAHAGEKENSGLHVGDLRASQTGDARRAPYPRPWAAVLADDAAAADDDDDDGDGGGDVMCAAWFLKRAKDNVAAIFNIPVVSSSTAQVAGVSKTGNL